MLLFTHAHPFHRRPNSEHQAGHSTEPATRPRPRRLLRQLRSSHTRPRITPLPSAHPALGLAWSARTRTSIAEVELGARREADDDIGPAHLHLGPASAFHAFIPRPHQHCKHNCTIVIQRRKQLPNAPATHFARTDRASTPTDRQTHNHPASHSPSPLSPSTTLSPRQPTHPSRLP